MNLLFETHLPAERMMSSSSKICKTDDSKQGGTPCYFHTNAIPRTAEGHVVHLGLGVGDVANNIVTVGCESRCKILVELLDRKETSSSSADVQSTSSTPGKQDEKILPSSFYVRSKRGFITHTGTFNGVPVSIVMINMGYPNMDFLVREIRAVTEGALRIIRLGSCAGLRPDLPVGTVAVASEGSILIRQNPDAWGVEAPAGMRAEEPYLFHRVVPADEQLSRALIEELKAAPEEGEENSRRLAVVGCLNVSSDSFYSSQGQWSLGIFSTSLPGRIDPSFEDRNDDLLHELRSRHPSAGSFEMETFQLLHLARICRKGSVHASVASIVLANRVSENTIPLDRIPEIERRVGEAVLRAITASSL